MSNLLIFLVRCDNCGDENSVDVSGMTDGEHYAISDKDAFTFSCGGCGRHNEVTIVLHVEAEKTELFS